MVENFAVNKGQMPAANVRFGATAAGSADLKGSAKIRRCAKPPSRCVQADERAVDRVAETAKLEC